MFCLKSIRTTHGSSINHDNKVVDLTTDISDDRNMRPEAVLTPCLVKLPKRTKLINDESNCKYEAFSEICCKQSSPSSSHLETVGLDTKKRTPDLVSPMISKYKQVTSVAKEESLSKFSLKKEGQSSPLSNGQDVSRGSAFLAQVLLIIVFFFCNCYLYCYNNYFKISNIRLFFPSLISIL